MIIILETAIMKKAIEFLIQKNYVANIQEAKKKLKELWFDRYNRDGTSHSDIGTRYVSIYFIGYVNNTCILLIVYQSCKIALQFLIL